MNSCNTCCNPKTPDCNSIEMSNLQRCHGVTMHGCGNPMYNVYCWDHAHPMCHKPEPVAIEHLCAYLRKDEASHIYATKQGVFDLQTIISNTYQTKEDAANIDQKIDQEIADRLNGDTRLEGEIQAQSVILEGVVSAESTRAKAAEQTLQNNIDSEVSRAQTAEQNLNNAVNSEISRATNREDELHQAIQSEATRAITKETELQSTINAETNRAVSTENALQNSITAEKNRAQNAEAILDTAVQSNTSAIRNEAMRAQTAEQNVASAVSTLNNKVSTDVVHSADYDSANKQIVFKNSEGTIIDSIDASQFVKDGMVSSVRIVNGVLKITFNTDAGKQDIDIPVSDIFDADNYYTKSQCDGKFATKAFIGDYYTKSEVDAMIQQAIQDAISGVDLSGYYTKGETDYKLNNYYTKSQTDAKFAAV